MGDLLITFCFYKVFWCEAMYFLSVHLYLHENSILIFYYQRKKHIWWLMKQSNYLAAHLKTNVLLKVANYSCCLFAFIQVQWILSQFRWLNKWHVYPFYFLVAVNIIELVQNHGFHLIYKSLFFFFFGPSFLGWALIFLGVIIIFPTHIFLKCVHSLATLCILILRSCRRILFLPSSRKSI